MNYEVPKLEQEINRFFQQVDPLRKIGSEALKNTFEVLVVSQLDPPNREAVRQVGLLLADKWYASAKVNSTWGPVKALLGSETFDRIFPGVAV